MIPVLLKNGSNDILLCKGVTSMGYESYASMKFQREFKTQLKVDDDTEDF